MLNRRVRALEKSLAECRGSTLFRCAGCGRICDEEGRWAALETYIANQPESDFSGQLCPDCLRQRESAAQPGFEQTSRRSETKEDR